MGNTSSTYKEDTPYTELFKEWLEKKVEEEDDLEQNKPYRYSTVLNFVNWEDESNKIEVDLDNLEIKE